MKKLILITMFLMSGICFSQQVDSLAFYRNYYNHHHELSVKTFNEAYQYETLLYYYNICKKKPKQWKYYRSWATRVFEYDFSNKKKN